MTLPLTGRLGQSFTRPGRNRTYGSPRHLDDGMMKDIGFSADDLGLARRR